MHNEIRAALKLITWLRDNGTSLADCTQHDIDTWLTGGPGTNYHARAFVLWASRRGHTRDLDIPQHPRSELLTQIEEDERWALVRGLLHDDTRAIEDRVAGLLVLLYGQPLARIARLTRGQIIRSPQQVQLLLGTVPLDLPEPLGELVRQLLGRHPRPRSRRPRRRSAMGLPRRSPRPSALHRPAQSPPRAPGHPRPLRPQHRPHGPRRQAPARRARPAARHQHQHRGSLGRPGRRLIGCLRRTGLPQGAIQHVLISLVTNIREFRDRILLNGR